MSSNAAVVGRASCPLCNSRDNVALYADGGQHCFSPNCTYHISKGSTESFNTPKATRLEMTGTVNALPERGISKKICQKFGVTSTKSADGSTGAHYYPLYHKTTGQITASKKRSCHDKTFAWSGDRSDTGLFGQNVCKGRGKYLTITEGELDALSVSEMFDGKWDVVSIRDGAQSAARDVKDNLEWLEGYDSIVLCMDADESGTKALDAIKDLFSPDKVKICKLPLKDPNALLMQGRQRDFISAWWDSRSYSPAGIVKADETWDAVLEYKNTPYTPYPWKGLTDMLLGQRAGELNIWAAETSVGKSQVMRELIHDTISTTDETVGCLMLEESVAKSMLGWASFYAGRPLHRELDTIPEKELRKYWEKASQDNRMVLLDHKGWQSDIEVLKARIRYMAKALGCKKIVLDHLHMALSSVQGATGDWAGIDELTTQLTVLAIECQITLHVVCHVSGNRSLRGSKGIEKLADGVIFLERDKLNIDPEIANTTQVIVAKNRFGGDLGTACYLYYDKLTGRMTECAKPEGIYEADEF